MNVYQLLPAPCYDDNDDMNSDFWSAAVTVDGRTSRNGFYSDDDGCDGRNEMGWYRVADHEDENCAASGPPVPHLLPFDARHQQFRFFDDEDSSADNETFFGRTLDTISEEDEDEVMQQAAETEAQPHRHKRSLHDRVEATDHTQACSSCDIGCLSVQYGTPCSSPIHVVAESHPHLDLPPLWQRDVFQDLSTDHLYSTDSFSDWMSMSNVLCDSEDMTFDIHDCRFGDRLASFRDDSFDKLPLIAPAEHQFATQRTGSSISTTSVDHQRWLSAVVDEANGDGCSLVNEVEKSIDTGRNLSTGEPTDICSRPPTSTNADFQPCSQNSDKTTESLTTRLIVNDMQCSSVAHTEPVKQSISLYPVEQPVDSLDFDVAFSESESINDHGSLAENPSPEETKGITDNGVDLSLDNASLDSSVDADDKRLSRSLYVIDKLDEGYDDDHHIYYSCNENIEMDKRQAETTGWRDEHCSACETDRCRYGTPDRCTSIDDRVENENSSSADALFEKTLDAASCEIPIQSSRNCVEITSFACSEKPAESSNVSADADGTMLSASPTAEQYSSYTDGLRGTASSTTHVHLGTTCIRDNDNRQVSTDEVCVMTFSLVVRRSSDMNDDGDEQQADETIAEASTTFTATESDSWREKDCENGSQQTARRDSRTLLFTETSADGVDYTKLDRCYRSFQTRDDKLMELSPNDASDSTHVAKTQRGVSLRAEMSESDMETILPKAAREGTATRSAETMQRTTRTCSDIKHESSTQRPMSDCRRPISSQRQNEDDCWSPEYSSSTHRDSSLTAVEVGISTADTSSVSAETRDEHRRRLEATRKQLADARPVAPSSSSIDAVWNLRIARKLTPAARSRSAVWTPYDPVFSGATATRRLNDDDRMWRTTSLQTLPGKLTSVEFRNRQHGSTNDLGSEEPDVKEDSPPPDISVEWGDKSKSLCDLRRTPDDEQRVQVYEFGSIDGDMNTENKISFSSSSRNTAPHRPLPSEEFIRRSLERLNLPHWYINSSSTLRKKTASNNGHGLVHGSTSATAMSSSVHVQRSRNTSWQSPASATEHCDACLPEKSVEMATPCDFEHSTAATTDLCSSTDSQQRPADHETSTHQAQFIREPENMSSVENLTSSVTEQQATENGMVYHVASPSRKKDIRDRTSPTENEYRRYPHRKETGTKYSRCKNKKLDTVYSTAPNTLTVNNTVSLTSESVTGNAITPLSGVLPVCITGNGEGNCSSVNYSTSEEHSSQSRRTGRWTRTGGVRKSNKRIVKLDEDNVGEEASTADHTVADIQASHFDEDTAVLRTAEETRQNEMPTVLASSGHGTQTVRPRTVRRRKLKSTSDVDNAAAAGDSSAMSTYVNDRFSGRKPSPSNSSRGALFSRSPRNTSHEKETCQSSERQIAVDTVLAAVDPAPYTALDLHEPRCVSDSPAEASGHGVPDKDERKKNAGRQRRRRRQQPTSSTDKLLLASSVECQNEITTSGTLPAYGDRCTIECDAELIPQSTASDRNHVAEVKSTTLVVGKSTRISWEFGDGVDGQARVGGGGSGGKCRRRRRRIINKAIEHNAPAEPEPSKCLFDEQGCHADSTQEQSTSSLHRRRHRRRVRTEMSSGVNVERQRQRSDVEQIQKRTLNVERDSDSQFARLTPTDASQVRSSLEDTVNQFFKDSAPTSTDHDHVNSSNCQPTTQSTSCNQHYSHRRLRCFGVTGSNSLPLDSAPPMATDPLTHHEQVQLEATAESCRYRVKSPTAERKPCMSAAARRCRHADNSLRSRSGDRSRVMTSLPASITCHEVREMPQRGLRSPPVPSAVSRESWQSGSEVSNNGIWSSDRKLTSKSVDSLVNCLLNLELSELPEPPRPTELLHLLRIATHNGTAICTPPQDFISGDVTVRCGNYECCGATVNARASFSTCRYCYTYYCSRKCKQADRKRHRIADCTYSRLDEVCQSVVRRVRLSVNIRSTLGRAARCGFRSRGRGCVLLVFGNNPNRFISTSGSDVGWPDVHWAYVTVEEVVDVRPEDEHTLQLAKLCRSYDPEVNFVTDVAILASNGRKSISGAVRCSATFYLPDVDRTLCRAAMESGCRATAAVAAAPETLILTAMPGCELSDKAEERRAREMCFANIQRQLSRRGVYLSRQYPDVYGNLCSFVADGRHFPAVSLYPVDSTSGRRFMCLIMLGSEPEVEWTASAETEHNRR